MHCADCSSENMRMMGSIGSPSWQCADCGSTRPPVHAHDKAPAVRDGDTVYRVDGVSVSTDMGEFTMSEVQNPQWYGYDPGADCYKLPEGVWLHVDGRYMADCRVCGDSYEVPCDLDEFDNDMSYCGKDPRCCP